MKRLAAAGAAIVLASTLQTSPAQASPAQASLRHDSGVIVYVSDRDTVSADDVIDEIYAIDPDTREVTRLTYDLPGVERWPAVSPDGRSLAWVRWEIDAQGVPRQDLSEIWRCDLRHRGRTLTCRHPRKVLGPVLETRFAWTADSRGFVFVGGPNADEDRDLRAYDLRSGTTTNLTDEPVDGHVVANGWPAVSPDGCSVVYARGDETGADLWRRDIGGGNPVRLTNTPGTNDVAPDYSPDGRLLVFHSTRDGDADIYRMKAAPETDANPAVNLTDGLRAPDPEGPEGEPIRTQERYPTFSPDGRRIAFFWFTDPPSGYAAGFNDGEVYRMDVDGGRVVNLTRNNPTDPMALTVGDIQPAWGEPARRRHWWS